MHKCKEHLHHTSGTEGASSISPGLKSHCSTTLGQISEQPLLTARHIHMPKAAVPQAPSHCHCRGKQCLKWGADQLQNQILSAAKKSSCFFGNIPYFLFLPPAPTRGAQNHQKNQPGHHSVYMEVNPGVSPTMLFPLSEATEALIWYHHCSYAIPERDKPESA